MYEWNIDSFWERMSSNIPSIWTTEGFPLGCSVPQTLEMANGDTFDFPFMQSANQTPCVCTKSNYYLLCAFNWKLFQITGGGNGIGKAIAFELARHGCKIAIVDIDHQAAMTTANAVKKMHVVDVRGYCVSGRLHQSIDQWMFYYTTILHTKMWWISI